ncbi:MAG: nucleotidyltransferase family protein [Candidatus Omnitrophica bacterium]|nr:nucleotidyltransferase family protein [Candidatus Omnitrophota bacterium]
MKALILAAGYAVRLYPLTKEMPKSLLPVQDKPIIDYIVAKLRALEEIREIIVVTNSKFISQFQRWRNTIKDARNIRLVDDLTKCYRARRGAVGDIGFVIDKEHIKDDLLVIGGDNLFDADLKDFLSFARTKDGSVVGVYNIKDKRRANKFGVLKLDGNNRIVDFKEKPKNPESTLVAMCLYYFPKNKLGRIKEYLDNNKADRHDATGFYIDWLRQKEAVYGFVFSGRWHDIGSHQFYREAKNFKDKN